jgi:hypothetical protein
LLVEPEVEVEEEVAKVLLLEMVSQVQMVVLEHQ